MRTSATPTVDFYLQRSLRFAAEAEQERARYDRFTWVRLGVFVAGVILFMLLISVGWALAAPFAVVFLVGFYRFVVWHQGLYRHARYLSSLADLNKWEADALEGNYQAYGSGAEYVDAQHPYSYDLDIFGAFSLFQFLNRTVTVGGRHTLASWLSAPADEAEITDRQAAVQEMAAELEWRQQLQAGADGLYEEPDRLHALRAWLADAPVVAHSAWIKAALWVAPFWFSLVLVLWLVWLPWGVALLLLLPPGILLARKREEVDRLHLRTGKVSAMLSSYAGLLAHVEQARFGNARLQRLHEAFAPQQGVSASAALRRLSYCLGQLDVRYNVFSIFLQFGGLWDLQWAYQIDRWKAAHGTRLFAWFDALSELEALSSLGNLHFNQPDWAFAELTAAPQLTAEALGHPLIHARKRVVNDLSMATSGHLHLVTGSNMAGKSTWLRTAGLNIVLALCGAPACARKLSVPPLQVYTSMRTQDALHESTSSFYAELKRLKFIIEAVEDPAKTQGRPVFFILDEILKGTNSRDRHTGASALIRQLIKGQGGGMVATHDLELGALEAEAHGRIENWAMEVAIEDGELLFDYRLRRGVSQSFNATLLMQRMGIQIS